ESAHTLSTSSLYVFPLDPSFFVSLLPRPPLSTLFPYTTLFRSAPRRRRGGGRDAQGQPAVRPPHAHPRGALGHRGAGHRRPGARRPGDLSGRGGPVPPDRAAPATAGSGRPAPPDPGWPRSLGSPPSRFGADVPRDFGTDLLT